MVYLLYGTYNVAVTGQLLLKHMMIPIPALRDYLMSVQILPSHLGCALVGNLY